jgi:hypothetical protein
VWIQIFDPKFVIEKFGSGIDIPIRNTDRDACPVAEKTSTVLSKGAKSETLALAQTTRKK